MPMPYGNCVRDVPAMSSCELQCKADYLYAACGCTTYHMMSYLSDKSKISY